MNIEGLMNLMRREAMRAIGERGIVKQGIVSSYDPSTYSVKVILQPEGVESGWLPVAAAWVGAGWGMYAPPSPNDMVDVHYMEGSRQAGYVSQRFFADDAQPSANNVSVPSGEIWLVHKSQSYFKLTNDGKVSINGQLEIDLSAPTINITCTGSANVTAPAINLGSSGGTLLNLVNSLFMALYNGHTHPTTTAGQPTGVPVVQMTTAQLTTVTKAN